MNGATPFSQAVREGFPRWCKPGKFSLTTWQMDDLISKPGLSPEDVATLSVLKPMALSNESLPIAWNLRSTTISSETMDAYEEAAALGEDRFLKKVEDLYQDKLRRVQATPSQLFGPAGPQAELIRQGSNPNCVLTSTVIGLAHHRPEELREMVRQRPSGEFEVHFRDGGRAKVVASVSAGEVVKNSCAFESGLWMTVLDEAAGNVGMVLRSRVIKKMTGHAVDGDDLQWTRESTTRRKLTEATQAHRVVLACRQLLPGPPGLSAGHCYAVLGYEPQTDTIQLQDPAGNEPQDANGQALDGDPDGRFEMSVAQFYSSFSSIYYEQA